MNLKSRRLYCSILLLAALAIVGSWGPGSTSSAVRGAQVQDGKGKCVGISTERVGPTVVRIYRIFEDGTVEIMDNGEGETGQWFRVGK
jgi:hypothetical protein